jgi:hypothetical protein
MTCNHAVKQELPGGRGGGRGGRGSRLAEAVGLPLQLRAGLRTRRMFLPLAISGASKSYELCAASGYENETLAIN